MKQDKTDEALGQTEGSDDTLVRAVESLDGGEFIARTNYWCCQSCGVAGIVQEATARPGKAPTWYVFWHEQDEDGRRSNGSVYLSYGTVSAEGTEKSAAEAGHKIAAHLRERGIEVAWNGNHESRIKAALRH